MFVVLVQFNIKAEHLDAFVERVEQQANDSLTFEDECHQFDVSLSNDDPNLVLLYEIYSDREAFDAHLDSAHFRDFNAKVTPWVESKTLTTYEKR
tara:strand:- start:306 stop:590 length:285 start_codon:yes stop_codon:yes gene_type:complete